MNYWNEIAVIAILILMNAKGNVCQVSPVDDPLAYRRILAGLDRAVFLEREGL